MNGSWNRGFHEASGAFCFGDRVLYQLTGAGRETYGTMKINFIYTNCVMPMEYVQELFGFENYD